MLRNGDITLVEVKRIFRRYGWIPLVTTVVCGTLGFVATLVIPKKYTSATMVLVEQPTVPTDIVKPVVSDDLNHRLASMQEQILSRSRLQPIIEKFNLYSQSGGKEHMEDLIERLRRSIEVELLPPMPGSLNRQPPGFQVSVTFNDGQLAQQICTEITSMFMEQNAKRREQQSADTTHFLSQQLDEAKAKLDEQDAKLAQFKRQYLGSLPEEEQTNLNILTGTNTQLEAATQALSRGQQEANWKATQSGQQNPETEEQQLTALEDQLTAMLSRYTPEHPDVVKLKTQIEDLKRKIATAPVQKSPTNVQESLHEPPQLQQLRAKVKQDELNIAEQTKRQAQIQEQIRIL